MHSLTAHELHSSLINKKISSVDLTEMILGRIDKVESKTQSFVTVTKEAALKQAKAADQRLKDGKDVTPLTGIPIAIKDNMCTKGVLTTCSSKILANYIPPYNATVVEKLQAAGAVMIGLLHAYGTIYFPVFEMAFVFILLAAVLLVRPQGLFGSE